MPTCVSAFLGRLEESFLCGNLEKTDCARRFFDCFLGNVFADGSGRPWPKFFYDFYLPVRHEQKRVKGRLFLRYFF